MCLFSSQNCPNINQNLFESKHQLMAQLQKYRKRIEMPKENQPGKGFLKNKLNKLAWKYKPNLH